MGTHISKELALWLRDNGCRLPSEKSWGEAPQKDGSYKWVLVNTNTRKIAYWRRPAYSWYDILVGQAKSFFGDLWVCDECGKLSTSPLTSLEAFKAGSTTECVCRQLNDGDSPFWITKAEHATVGILKLLQNGDFQKAEAYVREHSLFNNPQ